jgi:hypothetical protein
MIPNSLQGIRIKVSVLMTERGYQGIVSGIIGRQTIWIDRAGKVRADILSAYTDAQCMAASVRA